MFEDFGFVEGLLLRIFVGEDARHGARPLYDAIVQKVRAEHVSGATVFRGVEGFGNDREMRINKMFTFGARMPMLIEVVDAADKVSALIPDIQQMIGDGLMTVERVSYRRYTEAAR